MDCASVAARGRTRTKRLWQNADRDAGGKRRTGSEQLPGSTGTNHSPASGGTGRTRAPSPTGQKTGSSCYRRRPTPSSPVGPTARGPMPVPPKAPVASCAGGAGGGSARMQRRHGRAFARLSTSEEGDHHAEARNGEADAKTRSAMPLKKARLPRHDEGRNAGKRRTPAKHADVARVSKPNPVASRYRMASCLAAPPSHKEK